MHIITPSIHRPIDFPMGACFSRYESADDRFKGLSFTQSYYSRALAYIQRMDSLNPVYVTHPGILRGMHHSGTWDIYLHVCNWDRPITHSIVVKLVAAFRNACRTWLSDLRGRAGFRSGSVQVRVFGFVFQKGVVLDASFLQGSYGNHPRVTEWPHNTEASPWRVRRGNGTTDWNQSNYYDSVLDLHSLRVVGNRTNVQGAVFHPTAWDGYTHPEQCQGYQTKYWLGATPYYAFAQRQYLRVSKVPDTATGAFNPYQTKILMHEMGHCFFLDDMYNQTKYPRPLPACGCSLKIDDTIMYGAPAITPMDRAMLRHIWIQSKK